MNVHHLELFYYVARHHGIAGAVRNIPYGIQQPAVSAQISRLEEGLGVKLFQRRPFALTPAGEELFGFIEPFFGELEAVEKGIRATSEPQLRIAAPAIVLSDYLPEIVRQIRARVPAFRLHLHEAARMEAEQLLKDQEVDFAITHVDRKERAGCHTRPLIELPLILLAPKRSHIQVARQLWDQDKIEETLITFPQDDALQAHFRQELRRHCIEWYSGIQVNSARLIECYVRLGQGIGLAVATPGFQAPAGTRVIVLEGFAPVTIGAIWKGKLSPLAQQFLTEIEAAAMALQ